MILYNLHEMSRIGQFMGTEGKWMLDMGWRWGGRESGDWLLRVLVFFYGDEWELTEVVE